MRIIFNQKHKIEILKNIYMFILYLITHFLRVKYNPPFDSIKIEIVFNKIKNIFF